MNQANARRTSLVAVILLVGAACLSASTTSKSAESRPVSNSTKTPQVCSGGTSLLGSYGMIVSGSGKFLSGEISFDGNCNITGNNISGGVGGQYSTTSVTGSYAPDSDGTYTITLNFANSSTPQTYIVGVSESGNKARGIESDNSLEAIIDIQSQLTPLTLGYTTANLTGTYVASCAGVGNTEFDSISFDGNGNVSGNSTYDNNGGVGSNPLLGTYSVNSDGTFSGGITGGYSFNGVIDDGISEIEYTYASGSSGVLACVGRQAMPSPTLLGYYGFVVGQTSHSNPGGEYYSGSLYFNGSGGVSGGNVSGGNGAQYGVDTSITGTYTVNPNNTITINLNLLNPAQTYTYVVGVSESGNEASGIETDGAAIATIDLQSQLQLPANPYSNASLAGTYSATCQGSEIDLNWTTFDGNGNITAGTDAYDNGGYGDNPYTGTYTVNSDGTFTGNFFGGTYDVYTMTGVMENGLGSYEFTYYDDTVPGGVVACIGESTYGPIGSNPVLPAPSFSPTPGSFTTSQSVTLSDSNPSATIYYTTNGTAPSTSSPVYNAPITVSATTTIQAMAALSGYNNSPITASTFFINSALPTAATPTFSPSPTTYTSAQYVTLSDTTSGAAIYYTTNGTTPTTGSAQYNSPIPVSVTTTIQAIAVAPNYQNSALAIGTFTIILPPATAPTFSPTPGTYNSSVTVTLADATPGTPTIYYTTNGTTPTTGSSVYSVPLQLTTSTTIEAIAVESGYSNSPVASATYAIVTPTAAIPVFSVTPGTYSASQSVALSDATAGATIYYTTNGTTPSATSAQYNNSPIIVSTTTTIQAVAVESGYGNSPIAIGTYRITSSGSTGTFSLVQHVNNTYCPTATSCTITLNQNINAGDLLVFEGSMYPASVMSGTNNGGSFTQCVSCVGFDPTNYLEETSGGWILAAAAQTSTIAVNFNAPASGSIEMWEYSVSGGTPQFDGANQIETQNSASPTATQFNASGTNDISVQACRADYYCNSVTAPFVGDNLGNYHSWGYMSTPANWATPTWTLSGSGTSQLTQMEFGFNVMPCSNGTFVDFGGLSGSAVSVAQLAAGTHGWTGGYWTVNGVASNLTYQTAASQTLQSSTGRLCDGGNYSDASTTGLQMTTNNPQTFVQMNGTNGMMTGSSVSAGVWYWSNVPATSTSQTDDIAIFGTGGQDFLLLHELSYNGNRIGQIECGTGTSAGSVVLARNTWYWVEIVYNTSGNHTMKVYNNANPPVQVGNTMTCASRGLYQPAYVTVGNVNSDPSLPPGYLFYYDGLLVSLDGDDPLLPAAFTPSALAPTLSPAPGTYTNSATITLTDTTPGAAIYYTTNGNTPTANSTRYTSPITVTATTTINAIAVASGYGNSTVTTGTYTIPLPPAPAPTFSPAPSTYTTVQSVTLSDTATGALIYYTTNGTTPTVSSPLFSGTTAIPVTASTTINAIAVAPGYSASTVATGTYTLNLPAAAAPTFSPTPSTYGAPVSVTLSDTTSGAVIHCTTDGTTPSANSPVCTTLTIGTTDTINAIAIAPGYVNSPQASALYTVTAPGTFKLVQHVNNTSCATATSCTITLSQNINSGDLLVFEGSMYPASIMTGTNNGGSFVQCVSCVGFDPTNYLEETTGGWILAAAAQASSITVTFNSAASGQIEMWDYAVSGGTPQFDGANQIETQNSATPTATPFTASGSNDISVQACRADYYCNSVTAPFVGDNLGNYHSWGYMNTPTNWATPSWTLSGSGTSQLTQMEFGFGTVPCSNSSFVDFGGPSGSAVSEAQLLVGTHGWTGGYWTINGVAANLTFQTAASQTLQQTTGRLCDGGNYSDTSTTGLQMTTNNPQTFVQMNGTNGTMTGSSVSVGAWYWSNLPGTSTSQTDDIAIFGTGGQDFLLLHELSYNGNRIGEIECGSGTSAGNVVLARNTWYWVEIVYNTSGNHTMKVYNNSNPPVQVGSTMTCPSRGLYQPAYVTVGNVNSDSSLPPGYLFYYDGLLVSLDGTDPLLPSRTVTAAAATPVFGTAPGTYSSTQSVTLSDATPGSTIYYTTNGTTPTTASTQYLNAPISVSATTTIEAIAVASGYVNSAVASGIYTITSPAPAAPSFSPAPGTYSATQSVTLSDTTTGATIYYTTNGTGPTAASSVYSAGTPISVSATTTIEAIAVSGGNGSAVATGVYTITSPAAATPNFGAAPGIYSTIQSVTLSDATTGATIYYTTNGTTPTTSSSVYSAGTPIVVSSTTTIEAIAAAPNYANSVVASATYAITPRAAAPTFSPVQGTYSATQSVTISAPGATIYYTTNGAAPTTSSSIYSSAISVSADTTIQAIAVASGYANSPVASATYNISASSSGLLYVPVTPCRIADTRNATGTFGGPILAASATRSFPIPSSACGIPSTALAYALNVTAIPPGELIGLTVFPTGQTQPTVTTNTSIDGRIRANGIIVAAGTSGAISVWAQAQTHATIDITGYFVSASTPGGLEFYPLAPCRAFDTRNSSQGPALTAGQTRTFAMLSGSCTIPSTAQAYSVNLTVVPSGDLATLQAWPTGQSQPTSTILSATTGANTANAAIIGAGTSGEINVYASSATNLLIDINGYFAPAGTGGLLYNPVAECRAYSASTSITGITALAIHGSSCAPPLTAQAYALNLTIQPSGGVGDVQIWANGAAEPTTSMLNDSEGTVVSNGAIVATTNGSIDAYAQGTASAVPIYLDLYGYFASGTTSSVDVDEPTFSPAPGSYGETQTVTLSDATAGAAIYYTTNGTTPTTSSTFYSSSSPITISATTTIEAIAVLSGDTNSVVASGTYTIASPTAATPTFSPALATYNSAQSVTLSDTTPGAAIYYTTNGTTPTTSSTLYSSSSAITVSATTTIEAIAVAPNYSNSAVATGTYTINSTTAPTPTFSPAGGTYTSTQTVILSDANSGASIYYTTNGTTPTTSSTLYSSSAPITVSANTTIEAVAVVANLTNSAVATASYTITPPAPAFSLAAGTYTTIQTVTLSDANASAAIYYTTNGTTPTASSTLYNSSSPISVSSSTTIEAIAVANGSTSAVATAAYVINLSAAATPTFSPAAGTYTSTQSVTLADTTTGASIYYTTNGTTPTTSSTPYSSTSPITVSANTIIEAIAVAANYTNSAVATAAYTITPPAPTFSLAAGTYTTTETITLSDTNASTAIYYTTNGTTPTASSTQYTSAITVSATTTIEAIAVANGSTSAVATAAYTINLPTAATPTFNPAAGTYTSTQSVTLADTTSGASIYYTTNGTTPSTSATKYSSAISVSATTTIEAIAVASNYTNSAVATATYTIAPPAPTFNLAAGTYTSVQTVALSDANSSTTIYYTTNGSTPTTSSTQYMSAITVGTTTTIEAIAVANGSTSAVATAAYTINLPTAATPTFSPAAGTYTSTQSVTLADTTSGASIYYTTNGTTPTTSSTKYSSAISVSSTTTIEAIAVASNYNNSAVATATYTINSNTTVNLASYYNVYGIGTAGTDPKSGGFDNDGYAYNSSLLGTSLTYQGVTFALAAANALDAVTETTVTLPAGQYGDLYLLGAAVNGAQANQSVVVTYSDGSTSTFTQTFSDWEIPQAYPGETTVAQIANRITPSGATMSGTIDVYGYTFALTAGKTVASVKLPANRNVVFLAIGLGTPAASTAIPTFSPAPGTYTTVESVTLSDATSGASIYYTTNGTTPTTSSTKYSSAISLSATSTLEAIAVTSTYGTSGVVSGVYAINLPTAATPTFGVAAGTYTTSKSVTLSDTTSGAVIYYTTNGTTPTTSSAKYSSAISVASTTTIEAIAVATGYNNSAVASATYTLIGTAVTPYIQVNGGAWQQTATVTVAPGATVNLGPQPLTGTFSWTGPNGYSSTSRQINSIPLSVGTNTYVFTYTNSSGVQTKQTFTITVT